jgi:hypothetical protein
MDILLMMSPHLLSLPFLNVETSRRKHITQLNLEASADAEKLQTLMRDANMFIQLYRPVRLIERGFSPEACMVSILHSSPHATLCPFLSVYGHYPMNVLIAIIPCSP